MPKIGKDDTFERNYTQLFRSLCAPYGELVLYERDRAARDIGLHLTRKDGDGSQTVSSAFCWFQLKGIQKSSKSNPKEKDKVAKLRLLVEHLKCWFLQSVPTYLGLYIESREQFLILNLTTYVANRWGASVLNLTEKQVTIDVPLDSVLDEQAFALILRESAVADWMKVVGSDRDTAQLGVRDYNLIWRMGTAASRSVTHRIRFWRWLTKLRGQLWIEESSSGDWLKLREHWEFRLDMSELPARYPYLEFTCAGSPDLHMIGYNEDEVIETNREDELTEEITIVPGVGLLSGTNMAGEVVEFVMNASLNELGLRLYEQTCALVKLDLLTLCLDRTEWISIAPWEHRSV
jgi:hypothetical protein